MCFCLCLLFTRSLFCFFFNDTATTEIYTYGHTLSLHDALPISHRSSRESREPVDMSEAGRWPTIVAILCVAFLTFIAGGFTMYVGSFRSEEHTSELQSLMRISYAVFCLKKKKITILYNQA